MENLPVELFNKIMLYNIHPVAELFKKEFEPYIRTKYINNGKALWAFNYLEVQIEK